MKNKPNSFISCDIELSFASVLLCFLLVFGELDGLTYQSVNVMAFITESDAPSQRLS